MSKLSTRQCENPDCGKTFRPNVHSQLYCTASCRRKAWGKRNPDAVARHRKSWRKRNPEKHKANRRKEEARRRKNNPEKIREIRQRWYWKDPEHARAQSRLSMQKLNARRRASLANGESSV